MLEAIVMTQFKLVYFFLLLLSFKNQEKKLYQLYWLCRNALSASFLTDKEQLFH